jgi:hypothetical protein
MKASGGVDVDPLVVDLVVDLDIGGERSALPAGK